MQNSEIKNDRTSKQIVSFDVPDTYDEFRSKMRSAGLYCDIHTNSYGYNTLGTPLNKNTLLKDETANKYGLSGDSATPDGALSLLGNFVQSNRLLDSKSGSVRFVQENWSTQLKISSEGNSRFPHGLILVSQNKIFLVWVAGGTGSRQANLKPIFGTQTTETATLDEANKTVTFTCGSNSTITYIGV